ncbi:MAG: hypothetical protein ABIT05_00025 [Chitinophagaceae bacterium]
MESKIDTPKIAKKKPGPFLPNYYKKIGIAIMILPLIIILWFKLFDSAFLHSHKEAIWTILPSIFILGLSFIAFAKDKVEDEMTLHLRLKAMGMTFGFGVFSVITQPIWDWVWGDPVKVLSSQHLIVIMLVFYIVFFFFLKRFR